jgi:hypothetical protein
MRRDAPDPSDADGEGFAALGDQGVDEAGDEDEVVGVELGDGAEAGAEDFVGFAAWGSGALLRSR